MTVFLAVICGVLGLAIGSFLNVVIYRVPRKESIVHPRSRCPACGVPVADRDNVPVVSYLLLRGRCRACSAPIPLRYPLVELGTSALFVAVALRFGFSGELPAFCVFVASLLALALIDFDHFLLPSRIIYSTLAVEIVLLTVTAAFGHQWHAWERAWIGGLAAFVAFFVVHFVYPAGMAWGDLRLAGLIGGVLGWLGYGYVELGLFLAFLSASVVGVALILAQRASRKTAIPFGVFLAVGAALSMFWGHALIHLYTAGRA